MFAHNKDGLRQLNYYTMEEIKKKEMIKMNNFFYAFLEQLMKILKKQSLIYALGFTSAITFVIYVLQKQFGILNNYNIFILFIFTFFITIALFEYKYRPVKKMSKRKARKKLKEFLEDDNKRTILEDLYNSEGNPVNLNINNVNVNMLAHFGMIFSPQNISIVSPIAMYFGEINKPYVLTPFAENELKKYFEKDLHH